MYFVHKGSGTLETNFGPIDYGPGDYLVIPIGTTFRLVPSVAASSACCGSSRPSEIVPPKRYRNDYGQLLEHSPYCERDIRPPAEMARDPRGRRLRDRGQDARQGHRLPLPAPPVRPRRLGRVPVAVRLQHRRLRADHRARPPAAAGAPHLPAAQLRDLLFVPRKFDYHPLAIPAPYNHSNINSDEVIYYVAGNFMSRRGRGHQLLHHPSGRHPARAASGHGRGAHRQGGDRGAGGHDRHVPPAAPHEARRPSSRTSATRTRGSRRRTRTSTPASSPSAAPRPSRTDEWLTRTVRISPGERSGQIRASRCPNSRQVSIGGRF